MFLKTKKGIINLNNIDFITKKIGEETIINKHYSTYKQYRKIVFTNFNGQTYEMDFSDENELNKYYDEITKHIEKENLNSVKQPNNWKNVQSGQKVFTKNGDFYYFIGEDFSNIEWIIVSHEEGVRSAHLDMIKKETVYEVK